MTTTIDPAKLDADTVAELLGYPFEQTAHSCHSVSLALVRTGVLGVPGKDARVARGYCGGVGGRQHSWIVTRGFSCYDVDALVVDATRWSYDPNVNGVWHGIAHEGDYHPKGGNGSIWTYGKPEHQGGPTIELTPTVPLSDAAAMLLDMIGPLDRAGWMVLANAPVGGWPAAEIFAAITDTEPLSQAVPIDVLGMLTDRNPGGLYW